MASFTSRLAGWTAGRLGGEKKRKEVMNWLDKTGLGQILQVAGDIALSQGAIKGVSGLKGLLTGGAQATAAGVPLKPLPAPGASTTTLAPRTAAAIAPPITPAATTAAKALPQGVTEIGRLASANPAEARALTAQMVQPKPTFMSTPRPALPPTSAPVTAPVTAQAPVGGMTPAMRATAQRVGGIENVANANITRGAGGLRGFLQGAKEYAPLIQATAGPVANVVGSYIDRSVEEEKMRREQDAKNRLAMLLMPLFEAEMGRLGPPRRG